MKLDSSFVKNIYATYGQEGKVWLDNLADHLDKLSAQWNFQVIQPVKDISYNFVAVVKLLSRLAILKTAPPAARLMVEAEWLNAHRKISPIIFHIDKKHNAYLMEKLEPGVSLKYLVKEGNDEKATRIMAQVVLDLQSTNNLDQKNYQHISEHISSFSFLRGHIDSAMIDCAESLFNDLCTDRSNDIVLHGDLHHDNILQSGTNWNVIDPHGYIGNPCAEVGTIICNPFDCFPQHASMKNIIETRLNIFNEMLPFELERMRAWSFCLTLRSAAWDIEGFGKPNCQTIEIANILYHTLRK